MFSLSKQIIKNKNKNKYIYIYIYSMLKTKVTDKPRVGWVCL